MSKIKQLSKPCDNCPFTRGGITLHPKRAQELADDIRNDAHFYCHKTVDYGCDESDGCSRDSTREAGLCVGALVIELRDMGHLDQMGRIMSRVGGLPMEEIVAQADDETNNIFSDFDEFVEANKKFPG